MSLGAGDWRGKKMKCKKQSFNNLNLTILCGTFVIMLLCIVSCETTKNTTKTKYFSCHIDAIGSVPLQKTYYIESHFPEDVNPLVVEEYMQNFETIMDELGYELTDSTVADLKIAFGYSLGGKIDRAYTYSRPIYQYTPSSTSTTVTHTNVTSHSNYSGRASGVAVNNQGNYSIGHSTAIGSGNGTATIHSTSTTRNPASFGIVGTAVSTEYVSTRDFALTMDAYDLQNNQPVWSVRVNDEVKEENALNMRKYMKYYLLCTKSYIGTNSNGRKIVSYSEDEIRNRISAMFPIQFAIGSGDTISNAIIENRFFKYEVIGIDYNYYEGTMVYKKVTRKGGKNYIHVSGDEYIEDADTGERYRIIGSSIAKKPQRTTLQNNVEYYTETYPSLPQDVHRINISSGGSEYYIKGLLRR